MTQPLHKNNTYDLRIEHQAEKGDGMAYFGKRRIFIPGGLPGDTAGVKILKIEKTHAYGKLMTVHTPSPDRVTPVCPVADKCGGCQLQHQRYDSQLRFKQARLQEELAAYPSLAAVTVSPFIKSHFPYHYRNKAQFALRRDRSGLKIGLYATHSHRVIDIEECPVQHKLINKVLTAFRQCAQRLEPLSVYDEETHSGELRHLVIRAGSKTKELLVGIVSMTDTPACLNDLVTALKTIPEVKGILLNINPEKTDTVLGPRSVLLHGRDHIFDEIHSIRFKISLHSFFQSNAFQTEELYNQILRLADLNGAQDIWDVYCGVGTIGLFLARHAHHVTAVETIPDAVRDARANAELNQIKNITILEGKAEDQLPNIHTTPDVVILDPPRKGCHETLLRYLGTGGPQQTQAKKIIYVSCNPVTLARDLDILARYGYTVKKLVPVDMFPHSPHTESVTLLEPRDSRVRIPEPFNP